MCYDHHKKAGNQGDVVKHVALVAILDTLLKDFERPDFRYADTFAGYAYSPIVEGNEWADGIGQVVRFPDRLLQNPHTKLWYEWYLRGRPQLLGGTYPGSSRIASDVCRLHGKNPILSLWDISPPVIANLKEAYHGLGHGIFTEPAQPTERSIEEADFLFIDPPGASMRKKKGDPHWKALAEFFQGENRWILVWLPVMLRKKNGDDIEDTKPQRQDALTIGLSAMVVRWRTGVRTVGCQLLYRLPDDAKDALRQAVDHVVQVAGWQHSLPKNIKAFEPHSP